MELVKHVCMCFITFFGRGIQSLLLVSHHEKTILPSQEAVLYWKEGALFYLENNKLHSRSLQGVLQFELAEEQSFSISSITFIL